LLPQEYLADAESTVFGVQNIRDFATNYASLWTSVGVDRFWGEPRRLLRDAGTVSLSTFPNRLKSFLADPKEFPSLLLLAGLGYMLMRKRGALILLLVPYLAVAAPIAWWGVRQRFLIGLYPLIFLVLAAGCEAALRGVSILAHRRWYRRMAPVAASALLLGLAAFPWRLNNFAEAREVHAKNWGRDYAFYEAIQAARELPGVIAFAHRSSIVLALFGERDEGRAVFTETHLAAPTSTEQWEALQRYDVQYIVARHRDEGFLILTDPRFLEELHVIREFEHPQQRGGPDRATIYATRRN